MLKSLSSRKIPSLFGKEERRGRPSKSEGNVGKSKAEPQSIVGKYRKEFGSLKAGENQRMYDSVTKCIVVAEGAEQQKREHHLKLKRSWIQSDTTMNNMEVFFRCAMPNSGFSRMLNAMEEKLSNAAIGEFDGIRRRAVLAYFRGSGHNDALKIVIIVIKGVLYQTYCLKRTLYYNVRTSSVLYVIVGCNLPSLIYRSNSAASQDNSTHLNR